MCHASRVGQCSVEATKPVTGCVAHANGTSVSHQHSVKEHEILYRFHDLTFVWQRNRDRRRPMINLDEL